MYLPVYEMKNNMSVVQTICVVMSAQIIPHTKK